MTTLILSDPTDEHAQHIHQHLTMRGNDVEFLNTWDFPKKIGITYNPANEFGWITFEDGRQLLLEDVHSVYWRNYMNFEFPEFPDPEQAEIAYGDSRSLMESLLIRLPARWVNGWEGFQFHQTKPAAFAAVAELGVETPATLLTNDPIGVRQFLEQHKKCIFKPVQGGAHTRRITEADLTDEHLANLNYAPVTLQEEVEGTDVRVFIAGERVLACQLETDALDFRDDQEAAITPVELPPEIVEQSIRIARRLNLLWTGIDYRRTDDGRYVYFEANPSPMFIGFEEYSGLPLTDALLDLLCADELPCENNLHHKRQ